MKRVKVNDASVQFFERYTRQMPYAIWILKRLVHAFPGLIGIVYTTNFVLRYNRHFLIKHMKLSIEFSKINIRSFERSLKRAGFVVSKTTRHNGRIKVLSYITHAL